MDIFKYIIDNKTKYPDVCEVSAKILLKTKFMCIYIGDIQKPQVLLDLLRYAVMLPLNTPIDLDAYQSLR